MEALLTDTLGVSGKLYLRPPSQNAVFLNSHTSSVFLHSRKRPAPVTNTFFASRGSPLTRAFTFVGKFMHKGWYFFLHDFANGLINLRQLVIFFSWNSCSIVFLMNCSFSVVIEKQRKTNENWTGLRDQLINSLKVWRLQLTRIISRRLCLLSFLRSSISYALPSLIFKRDTDTFGAGPDFLS